MNKDRAVILLAAGKGKRMKSDLPKVLHEIEGRPMIRWLLDTLVPMNFDRLIAVIGHGGDLVKQALKDYSVEFVWQHDQLGTGHAVKMAKEAMAGFDGTTLVAAGDVPFLSRESIEKLFELHDRTGAVATCLSAVFPDPTGYGRIIRDGVSDRLKDIVEHKDASEEIRKIREINSGTFCFDTRELFQAIERIGKDNAQGEYYLTDVVKIFHSNGLTVSVVSADNPDEVRGVNSVDQLGELARKFAEKTR